jgi:hypothetical protein
MLTRVQEIGGAEGKVAYIGEPIPLAGKTVADF